MKILIIDDNKAVRMSLEMVLGDEFDSILTIGDPKLLPALLSNGDFDAVLLDMNFDNSRLDGSDGLFWLTRIKEMPQPPAVVLITAFGDIQLAVEAMKRGGDDFVTKPWDNDDLIAKVKSAIRKNRVARSDRAVLSQARDAKARQDKLDAMTLDELKSDHINSVVARCNGNLTQAARMLGINRQTLYNQLKK
ncbi:MAG: response regulator [Muribaculaceae bacterium]|nr:response regulator [Muribaculaceae bacterium]MBP3638803.1 response regulator [Muribaculaceae bacterium]